MNKLTCPGLLSALLIAAVGLTACQDGDAASTDEPRLLTRQDPASASDCQHGGQVVSSGLDRDGDGLLDDDEVASRSVVCADAPEEDSPLLTRIDVEPAGAHCPEGGSAVRTGLDRDRDGVLEDDEVLATSYLCTDALLTRMAAEPAGPHCGGGGIAFDVGRDRDGDGVLGDDEVELTEYECNQVISRDVTITSDADAALLAGIQSIQGSLTVDSASVHALDLPALEHVGGRILIQSNGDLERVAMPALVDVGGYLALAANQRLSAVDLPSLRTISGDGYVAGNPALASIEWSSLYSVGFGLTVDANPSLAALDMPSVVRDDVRVTRNPALTELTFYSLYGLKNVLIAGNGITTLTVSVSDFVDPDGTIGAFEVRQNPALAEVYMDARRAAAVTISGNDALTNVHVVVDHVDGDVGLSGAQLRTVSFWPTSAHGWLEIGGLLRVDGPVEDLMLQVDGHNRLGAVDLENTRIERLDYVLNQIAGTLRLAHNAQLIYFRAVKVGGLELVDNDELLDFYVIDQDLIAGDVLVSGNAKLEYLAGLQWVKTFGGSVTIMDNDGLVRPAIYGPTSIVGNLRVANNPRLSALDFNEVRSIGGNVSFTANGMTTWDGLDALETTAGLSIGFNPQLVDISLPKLRSASSWLQVYDNPELRTLALPALTGTPSATVMNSPHLAACAVEHFFAQLTFGSHYQQGNDTSAECP